MKPDHLVYSAWVQNAAVDATLSVVDGTADAQYPVAALVDGDQTSPCKLTGTSGLLLLRFAAPVHLAIVALFHHNLDAGLEVEIRGYSVTPTALADPADLVVPVTIGALEADGFRPNVWGDVDAEDPAASYLDWGVAIVGTNSASVIVGELWADTAQRMTTGGGLGFGVLLGSRIGTIRHETYGGLALKAQKEPRREHVIGVHLGTEAECLALGDWFRRAAGMAMPNLIVPRANRPEVYLMEFLEPAFPLQHQGGDCFEVRLPFLELSRGLRWD